MPENTPQHELSNFLQSELLHSLGSYGVAVERLEALKLRVEHRHDVQRWQVLFPARVIARTRDYNVALRDLLHRPATLRNDHSILQQAARTEQDLGGLCPPRHPTPQVILPGEELRFEWVVDFYATAIVALRSMDGKQAPTDERRLGARLEIVNDPQRREAPEGDLYTRDGQIERTEARLEQARQCIAPEPRSDRAREILLEHLGDDRGKALHEHAIAALVEAHFRMHRIEHLKSHSFGDHIRLRPQIEREVAEEAHHSLVLNTFVYAVARSVPWIFAENEIERDYVYDNYRDCCTTLTPSYCMWISVQLVLLALHRRGYTWWLLGEMGKAYGDFHKLRRLINSAERSLEGCPSQAPGAMVFLHALASLADHHTGRLYRAQHAHTAALRHFGRAASRLGRLEEIDEAREALSNSRWRIQLLVNQGKANYELGLVKRALYCYVTAWRALLELGNTESVARANFEVVDRVVRWLDGIDDDLEIDKSMLAQRIDPLVTQLRMSLGPLHLRLLAAEIMSRIGHVLLILRLPAVEGETEPLIYDDRLAERCLRKAYVLDETSTQTASDLLKIEYRKHERARKHEHARESGPDTGIQRIEQPISEMSLANQWPSGGGGFEEAARVIEYVMQCWLNEVEDDPPSSRSMLIARELLATFLFHTDSSNVKLAQVYRYLMQSTPSHNRRAGGDAVQGADGPPALELVCARRYSSFFPFLPRPSAFRVPGGGYFVRVREMGGCAFGIVVDPGPNFLHNLYSCGYSLDDVHMVIVTHDHADHLAALDALLALLGYRARLGTTTFKKRKLVIAGNASVVKRYQFYTKSKRDSIQVMTFEQLREVTYGENERLSKKVYPLPASLRIDPVATVEHYDAANDIAQGFLLSAGRGKSRSAIFFTSDTGVPPDIGGPEPKREAKGMPFSCALDKATVVVAHVSSVRLPELREIGGLVRPPGEAGALTTSFNQLWQEIYAQSQADDVEDELQIPRRLEFLLRELQFGFHSLPGDTRELDTSPLDEPAAFRKKRDRHLYLSGILAIAERMAKRRTRPALLLIGELREELGTFRTGIAETLNRAYFSERSETRALTMDIGLRLRVKAANVEVLCTTCDLDNDLADRERFHAPKDIREVCVKGEDEGVFYNCKTHDRRAYKKHPTWIERVERYNPFGRYDPFRP